MFNLSQQFYEDLINEEIELGFRCKICGKVILDSQENQGSFADYEICNCSKK